MRTLMDTSLFKLFASYLNGMELAAGELPAAYENFVNLLAELPQEEAVKQLRRLNFTRIELAFMKNALNDRTERGHVLYDVFIGKTLALLDAEIEMIKDLLRHGGMLSGVKTERVQGNCGRKAAVTLTWNGTDSDLIELVAALMAAGAIGTVEGRELKVVDVIRVFEETFHLKINALYTKRGKVFDRCTDPTPFIDSLRKSYNRMLDQRLA